MYADERFSRSCGEPEAKSTEYTANVKPPFPRFSLERNTSGGGQPPQTATPQTTLHHKPSNNTCEQSPDKPLTLNRYPLTIKHLTPAWTG